MKQKLVLSIVAMMIVGCNKSELPLFTDGIKFPIRLTSSGKDFNPYWSTDGKNIAFLSTRNTHNPNVAAVLFELWLMDRNGSDQHPIIAVDDFYEGAMTVANVSWSKDSRDVLVEIHTQMGSEIWRVTVDGGKTKLSSRDDWVERPKYSPDGTRVAFLVQDTTPSPGSPTYELIIVNSDFSKPLLIEKGLIQDFDWKIDSQGLIYSLYDRPNENYELWKSSIAGTERSQFSETPMNEENPSFSSDGKYIAFSAQDAVYVTPTHAFQPQELIDKSYSPRWILNRNLILVARERTRNNEGYWTESWVVDLGGNAIMKIAEGNPTSVNFSSDGEYFVYSLNGNLWLDQMRM